MEERKQSAAENNINEVKTSENTAAKTTVVFDEKKLTKEEKQDIKNGRKAKRKADFDAFVRAGALSRRLIVDKNFDGLTRVHKQMINDVNRLYLEKYTVDLMNHKITTNYFQPVDGEIYYLVKKFLKAPFGTPDGEIYVTDLFWFINQRWSWITIPSHDVSGLKKKFKHNQFRKAFYNASTINCLQEKENPLKEAVWMAVHSFIVGIFLREDRVSKLIPKGNDKLIPLWNHYLEKIDDVPEEVKAIFRFEDGTCPYLKLFADYPLDEDADVPEATEEEKKVATESAEMDHQFHAAIEKDSDKKVVSFAEAKKECQKQKECPKEEPVKKQPENQKKPVEDKKPERPHTEQYMAKKQEKISEVNINGSDVNIPENNKIWENATPRLNKFTHVVNKLGYDVAYSQHPNYPGLIHALIFTKHGVVNELTIDPCIIYGDTLRIVTDKDPDNDIRKETFIPISQENVVVKAIKGNLTKEDKKSMSDKIPDCLQLHEGEKYCLLDRVDFRGLKNGEKNGLPFDQWKELVKNCNDAIKMAPDTRFRIANFESPRKFDLVCDTNVVASFPTKIFADPTHQQLAQQGFTINVF